MLVIVLFQSVDHNLHRFSYRAARHYRLHPGLYDANCDLDRPILSESRSLLVERARIQFVHSGIKI